MARALDAKEEEWEALAAASPDGDFLQAKAKFHTDVLDDIRSQIQDHVNLPYEATSDEELFIALTEQPDAAYAEEGYDASARYRCYAEVLSETLPQWMETPPTGRCLPRPELTLDRWHQATNRRLWPCWRKRAWTPTTRHPITGLNPTSSSARPCWRAARPSPSLPAAVARAVGGRRVSAAADKGHDRHLTTPA
jgi:hypothetical protein